MNAAFSVWEERIAPVFDVATQAVLAAKDPCGKTPPRVVRMPTGAPYATIAALQGWCVDVLVCGAISRQLYGVIAAHGITVHSFLMGDLEELITAWRNDQLGNQRFMVPGCAGRLSMARGSQPAADDHPWAGRFGRGGPSWSGQGRHAHRRGQLMKPGGGNWCDESAAPPRAPALSREQAPCLCPHCGQRFEAVPGVPCPQRRCPNCHAPLVRA